MPTPDPRRLANQIALVTGASSGIGVAVAKGLAAHGAKVVVNYGHDEDGANATVAAIAAAGGTALAIRADVSQEDQVQAMFRQAIEHFGTIHIVVANSGIQQDAAFIDMTLAQWQRVIDVNLTGQFLCLREAAREFIRRGVQPEISGGRQNYLHELGARSYSLGRSRELRGQQGRYYAADEKCGPGVGPA